MDPKRRLFVGGHMHGKVESVPEHAPNINTVRSDGDGLDVEFTQVTYSRKTFVAGHTRIDVYVLNPSADAGEILAALAQAAGVDTGRGPTSLVPPATPTRGNHG